MINLKTSSHKHLICDFFYYEHISMITFIQICTSIPAYSKFINYIDTCSLILPVACKYRYMKQNVIRMVQSNTS